jgi:uncharacterized membrane protein
MIAMRKVSGRLIGYTFLIALAAACIGPLFWMVLTQCHLAYFRVMLRFLFLRW